MIPIITISDARVAGFKMGTIDDFNHGRLSDITGLYQMRVTLKNGNTLEDDCNKIFAWDNNCICGIIDNDPSDCYVFTDEKFLGSEYDFYNFSDKQIYPYIDK